LSHTDITNRHMDLNNGDTQMKSFMLQCMLGTTIVQTSQHALQYA